MWTLHYKRYIKSKVSIIDHNNTSESFTPLIINQVDLNWLFVCLHIVMIVKMMKKIVRGFFLRKYNFQIKMNLH